MISVLIADDDDVVRDVVRRYLERDGLEVFTAHDGTEALRLLGSRRIDVAVLDVMMPGEDGISLTRDLRRQIALVNQKVILFNDTVANNIAYGDLAGAPRADIEAAAADAYAKEFIDQLPMTTTGKVQRRVLRLQEEARKSGVPAGWIR